MHHLKSFVFSLVVITLFFSCDSDSDGTAVSVPVLETLEAEVFIDGGVKLHGELVSIGSETVTEYGFELDTNGRIDLLKVSNTPNRGRFSLEISQNLIPNAEYLYTAYAITESGGIYRGTQRSFISTGNTTPILTNVLPNVAHIGDTVILNGQKFGSDISSIRLNYGGGQATILSSSENSIEFIVPRPQEGDKKITLNVNAKSVVGTDLLDLYTPLISSIEPNEAFFGETIVIVGDHFDTALEFSQVEIGGVLADMISTGRNQIEAVVPSSLDYATNTGNIRVYAQNQWSDPKAFTLELPKFLEIPDKIYIDEYFQIRVERTFAGENLFIIDEYDSYPEILDEQTLEFYMAPLVTFNQRENFIQWIINGEAYQSPNTVTISNPFLRIGDVYGDIPFTEYFAFTKNNKGFVLGNTVENTETTGYLYEYDDSTNQWTRNATVENADGRVAVRPFFGHYVYSDYSKHIYGLRKGGYAFDFISIDSETGFHSELTPLPWDTYGTGFAYGSKVYFTTGPGLNEIWSYNIDSDQWMQETTLPFISYRGEQYNAIVVDNYVYVANGQDGPAYNDFWRMNLDNLQWERLADNPNPVKKATVYQFENELHFVSDDVWKYDHSTNTWEQMERDGISSDIRIGRFDRFIHNGIPYILEDTSTSFQTFLHLYKGDLVE